MSADFRLKQNLKMSPNAQIKNLVPENLSEIPHESEWKLGRFWFNTTIGKMQGVFLRLDKTTGLPVEPNEMEVRIVGADALGPTKDGEYWPDGLFDFTEQTKIADAMDDVNEALKDLSPPEATTLRGNIKLVDQEFLTGRISKQANAPDSLRLTDVFEGTEIDYIIADANVKATLPTDGIVVKGKMQQQFGKADQGIITVVVNDSTVDNGINLGSLFNEPSRDYFGVTQGFDSEINQIILDMDGNEVEVVANPNKLSYQSSTGTLTVNSVERYNDFKKWQKGSGSLNYSVSPGRHVMYVEHNDVISGSHLNQENQNTFRTNDFEVFYDPNTTAPTTQIVAFNISGGDIKNISGVPFYNNNISFMLDFKATDVFSYTYWDKPISMKMDGTTLGLMEWNHTSSNLNGVTIPLWNDSFDLIGYPIDYNVVDSTTDTVVLTTKAGKPSTGWGPEATITRKILIDSYGVDSNSSSLKETFNDEEYRINPALVDMNSIDSVTVGTTGTWDSTISLQQGEAQQFMGSLVKAQNSYSDYGVDVDYTAFAVDTQDYYRRIYTNDNKPNSNGVLKVETNGIIGTDFEIFIKLPEITGWLDMNKLLDIETFTDEKLLDGTGCGVNLTKTPSGYEIPWSVGTLSTVNSGFGYVVKIIIRTNNVKINEIEEISENWR